MALVCSFFDDYTKSFIESEMHDDSLTLNWHCFECKKEIPVSISSLLKTGSFISSELFCDEHKNISQLLLHNHTYIRYEAAFLKWFRKSILNNII